jgi:hypothetical protein
MLALLLAGASGSLVGGAIGVVQGVAPGIAGGVAAFATITMVLILAEAYRLQTAVDEYEARPRPQVTFTRSHIFSQQIVIADAEGHLSNLDKALMFGSVYAVNTSRYPDAKATNVVARVTYTPSEGTPFSLYGRWGGNTQPAELSPLAPLDQLRRIDLLPNGEEHQLDIVMKDPDDAEIYAYTNESQRAPNMKPPEYSLGVGPARIEVRLMGEAMHKDVILLLEARSEGAHKGMELRQIEELKGA